MRINFDELDVNLYDVLEIKPNADIKSIKDSYKKLVLLYHPDKNPNIDPELFSMISIAYRVLKKPDTRTKYDKYLQTKKSVSMNHNDIKSNYSEINKSYNSGLNKDDSKREFYNKMEELNRKHKYTKNTDNRTVKEKLDSIKVNRNNINFNFPKIFENNKDFSTNKFNNNFNKFKDGNKSLNINNQSIIKADSDLNPLAFNGFNNDYTSFSTINDIDKLYTEDSTFHSDNYTSLDNAFSLKQVNQNIDDRSFEDKLHQRKCETDKLKNLSVNDFENDNEFSILNNIINSFVNYIFNIAIIKVYNFIITTINKFFLFFIIHLKINKLFFFTIYCYRTIIIFSYFIYKISIYN